MDRMALALSRYRHEEDWRRADAWRRATGEPTTTRPVSRSKRLLLMVGTALLALIALAPPVQPA
jgi:hypothetical protein